MRWQLPIVWLIGSSVTGTIAVLFTSGRGSWPFTPLPYFSPNELLTLFILVGALFLALFALGWRTATATWLRWGDPRSVLLWALLVGAAGLGGNAFAAMVTFEQGFSLTTQLILAYTCGGLPFTLVACLLARPWKLNVAAAVLTAIALLTGWLMLDYPLTTVGQYVDLLVTPVTPL